MNRQTTVVLALLVLLVLVGMGCREEGPNDPLNPAGDFTSDRDGGDFCFRELGFWEREVKAALGHSGGRRQIEDETLEDLLVTVSLRSDLDFGRGDAEISFHDADAFLDERGSSSQCEKAMRHHLAALLNYAYNGADGTIRMDCDGHSGYECDLDAALDEIEASILDGDCEEAREIAERVNGRGCEDRHDDDDDDHDDDEEDDDEDDEWDD